MRRCARRWDAPTPTSCGRSARPERESKTYNRRIPEDDQYFVMHRVPPRGVTDKNGNLVEITPSKISFTLCDDIRERILNGEEV